MHPAEGETEAGHDLVVDEDGSVRGAELAEVGEEAFVRENEPAVSGVAFDDEGGEFGAVFSKGGVEGGDVVIREDDGEGGEFLGDACAVGVAEGEGSGAGFDEEGVDMPVVTASELDDLFAAGEAAGEANATEAGLGARVDEADHFDAFDELNDFLGDFNFGWVRGAEARAFERSGGDGFVDLRVIVPEDGGAPCADIVDEFVAIGGCEAGAVCTGGKER